MQANYERFITRVITRYEGGYGWDRGDSGGPTKYGITCYDLAEHLGKRMTSMGAWAPIVRAMSLSTAEDIYRNKYAKKCRFNELESGSDCVMLDYGINSGVLRPIWVAQKITGRRHANAFDDGLVKAINDFSAARFVDRMCDERMTFLRGLRIWPIFRGGWSTRVADVRKYCKAIANDTPVPSADDIIADRIPTVKTAQRDYNAIYHLAPPLDVDGYEGPQTKAITLRFQREHGLDPDGLIGAQTMAKLTEIMPSPATILADEMTPPIMGKGVDSADDLEIDVDVAPDA